jgi:septal ring factor EnvC (AmiA/AmiB activator)
LNSRYDQHTTGGPFIPKAASKGRVATNNFDLDRLERAIAGLVDSNNHLRDENAKLRRGINEGENRIRALDTALLAANQRRQDAYKRIDELIAHLDQLDEQLAETGE